MATPGGFVERFARVNGVRLRYLIGGQGSPVVLLHGYAQTGHMWRPIMPLLAQRHRVIVPDLRGAGGSAKPPSGYDKKNMAVDIHELTASLKLDRVAIVGHDIGLMVAYAYAAQFPRATERVVLMDAFLPGIGDWKHVWLLRDLWHFHFYGDVPLALVKGRERIYFEHFWNDFAADRKRSVPEADRRLYAKAYAQPGAMRAGFEYFRNFERDAAGLRPARPDEADHADAGPRGREGGRHLPHRAGQAGGLRRARPGHHRLGPLADGRSPQDRHPRAARLPPLAGGASLGSGLELRHFRVPSPSAQR